MSRIHQAIRKAEVERSKKQSWGTDSPKTNSEQPSAFAARPNVKVSRHDEPISEDLLDLCEAGDSSVGRVFEISNDPKLVALAAPRSLAGEQFRALMASLHHLRHEVSLKSILITSAAGSDGKTFLATNLALTLGQETDARVLLIDGDLRKPSVHQFLGFPLAPGLANYLKGEVEAAEIILQTDLLGLAVVPAGQTEEDSATLLNTRAMRDFLEGALKRFDWVLIDSPTAGPLSSTDVLSSLVDGVLLVARAGRTTTRQITACIATLRGKRLLGVAFNCVRKTGWTLSHALRQLRGGRRRSPYY